MKLSDVTQEPPPLVLRLELTKAEAQTLYNILNGEPIEGAFVRKLGLLLYVRGYRLTPKEP